MRIGAIQKNSFADDAGLLKGDFLVGVNDVKTKFFEN